MIRATCRLVRMCLVETKSYPLLGVSESKSILSLGGWWWGTPSHFFPQKPDYVSHSKPFFVVTQSPPLPPHPVALQPVSLRYEVARGDVLDDE